MKKLILSWLIPKDIYKGLLVLLQEAENCSCKLRIQMDRGETLEDIKKLANANLEIRNCDVEEANVWSEQIN